MIRYVLAVLLAVALLAAATPAIDRAATRNSDRQVAASVAAIDATTTSLVENERPSPDGHPDPRRVVEVTLPRETMTTEGVDRFEITPNRSHGFSAVRYVLTDGLTRGETIAEPIVATDPDGNASVAIDGGGDRELVLTLETDADGDAVVVGRWL